MDESSQSGEVYTNIKNIWLYSPNIKFKVDYFLPSQKIVKSYFDSNELKPYCLLNNLFGLTFNLFSF